MDDVEIKEVDTGIKEEKKPKKEFKKKMKDAGKVAFMEKRNEARKKAGLPAAYSDEDMKEYR